MTIEVNTTEAPTGGFTLSPETAAKLAEKMKQAAQQSDVEGVFVQDENKID